MSRAMMVFGGVVALSAAMEACGETVPAAVSLYGAPPSLEDAGAPPAPSAAPSAAPSGSTSEVTPPPGAIVAMYGAPPAPAPEPRADAGATKAPLAPAAAYGAPPSFLPPPKDGPKPKKP